MASGISFTDPEVQTFLDKAYQLMKQESLMKGTDRTMPVVEFQHPKELENLLDLAITRKPADHDTLLTEMGKIIKYSVKTGHPHFFNQLYGGLDPFSQAGSWLTETLSTNIHTFEASPVFVILEKHVFKKMLDIVGFPNGEGIFCPGGSGSNIMAMHLARHRKCPDIKDKGLYNTPTLRCYVSEDGHYSMQKGASYLGLGRDNMIKVKTDRHGRMLADDLNEKIQHDIKQGFCPLFVMASSGTTVLGSFDSLEEISQVCHKHGVWLHADACWGGGALLSPRSRHLMAGVEQCDSVAWNFHKFTGNTIQASAFLVKESNSLSEANNFKAEYLFQPDKFYDNSYDIGDRHIQCGRRPDCLKVWLQWKAMGDSGYEAKVDKAFDNANYLTQKVAATDGFRLVLPEFQFTNISFWYIPPSMRGQEETPEWWSQLGKVAPKIKELMVIKGSMMISFNPMSSKGFVNFFRVIVHNPLCEHSDMDFLVEEIDRLGADL